MRIFDRYVLKQFLAVFVGSLLTVSVLFTVLGMLDSITYLMSLEGATLAGIVRYYLLQLPQTIYMGSPVAALLSAMITLGGLNQRNELMAMRASGVSLFRAAAPIVAAAVLVSLGLFELGNTLVPVGNRYFLSARQEFISDQPDPHQRRWYLSELRTGAATVLRIERVDRNTGTLRGVTFFRLAPGFILADEVRAESASHEPGQGWQAMNVQVRQFPSSGPPLLSARAEMTVPLPDTPEDLVRIQRAPEEMTMSELKDQVRRVRKYGLPAAAYLVEYQARFAVPVAAVVLVLVGTPLAIRPVRGGGIALPILGAVMVGFLYFLIIAEFISLGKGGLISPITAAWTANVIFGLAGGIMFSGLRR